MSYWIAVVDDEALSLTNARILLGEEGMRVSCLRSGPDLLKFIEKNSPDLIILDILMPEMNGFEAYRALRNYEDQAGRPHVPVIFLTGEHDSAVEQEGLRLGASDFIHKPFDKEIILRRVQNAITNTRTIETLTEEAMIDKMTGLLNKSRGTERISKLCLRKTGALMIMDLDNFKPVNDLFGHDMGDRVLESFADIIRKNTRETDTVARIGGDEFLAFYEDLTDQSAVVSLTLRLNTQLAEEAARLMGEDHGIPLGLSVGVVMVPEYGRDYESLFTLADRALYTAKKNGKHGYHLYSRLSDAEAMDAEDPEKKLDRILKIVEERTDTGGALLLSSDSFSLVYRFIMRFYKRYGGTAALLLFTLTPEEKTDNLRILEEYAQFRSVLEQTLRMSDIFMQNGENSFFILLTERTRAEAEGARSRILSSWEETEHRVEMKIGHAFRYIDHNGEKSV